MQSRNIRGLQISSTHNGNQTATASSEKTFTLDYDENGNLELIDDDADTEMEYNWDNKLKSAVEGVENIALKYDPLGNRIWKSSASAGTRKYIVDIVGDLPVVLLELDASTFAVEKAYIYANSQILAQYDGDWRTPLDCKHFYLHDRLGSVRQIIDCQGYIVKLYTYNPFGETIEEDGSFDNSFMFTGQWYDGEISQYYLRARMYDPHLSRFTSRDPILGKFEEPLTLHKYLYCGNNPLNFVDLNGKWAFLIGGSLSGNIGPGLLFNKLTKGFGMIGYQFGLLALIEAEMGLGGTVGGALAVAKEKGKGGFEGLTWGWINWAAGGISASSGSGYSITADFAISPEAQKVTDLGGWFEEMGGSVTFSYVPPWLGGVFCNATVGGAWSRSVDKYGKPTGINLYTLSLGTGLPGVEFHGYKGYSWVYEWGNN